MMMSSVTSKPIWVPAVSPASAAASPADGEDDSQVEDALQGTVDSYSGSCSDLAPAVLPVNEAGQAAGAGLESFRRAMVSLVSLGGEPVTGDSDAMPLFDTAYNLETLAGRDAFWQHLSDRFEILQWYKDHVAARVQCTERCQLRVQSLTDGEDSEAEGLDRDGAAAAASQVAMGMAEDSSMKVDLVDNLDNGVAATLLKDCVR